MKQRNKDKWILGVNVGMHDASAALLRNGALHTMIEQERISRQKKALKEDPALAVQFCLDSAGIEVADLDGVAIGTDIALLNEWHNLTEAEIQAQPRLDAPERIFSRERLGETPAPKIHHINHHVAHAASTFYVSGFEEAAILVIDNRGENQSTSFAYGTRSGGIEILEDTGVEHSLGLYYRTAAQYAGLCGRLRTVGKFMGLSAYGSPVHQVPLHSVNGRPRLAGIERPAGMRGIELPAHMTETLLEYYRQHSFPFEAGNTGEVMAYADFAASVQLSIEQCILDMALHLKKVTGSSNLVLAGGVALNCKANGELADSGIFENIYVQPVAHDAGVSLGAALELHRQQFQESPQGTMEHAYWGGEFSDQEIRQVLEADGWEYEEIQDPVAYCDRVAEMICQHAVVGWFQGRSEVGPRALGARSILGHPGRRQNLIRINEVKQREVWRPLAPSVPEEYYHRYFEGTPSRFMIVAADVRPGLRSEIPAVVHVDGSARPQAVSKDIQPKYHTLLMAMKEKAGHPVLINTSFNLKDEPIVHSPQDALQTFRRSGLDMLALGSFIVTKKH